MNSRISTRWISFNILLGIISFVHGEHFFLPKENNGLSNNLDDDWVPISGIDKRSTRFSHTYTPVIHITPPVRYHNRPVNQQPVAAAAASNKVEVFAQPPPSILGSFSEFGHATIEAREPAHTLNFRPSYNFDRHYEEINDRRYQQNQDYQEPAEEQKPLSIIGYNAQQRHPQTYHRQHSPQSGQYFQYQTGHKSPAYSKEQQTVQEPYKRPAYSKEQQTVQEPYNKRPTQFYAPNDHGGVYSRPVGNKQAYVEQRPKPSTYLTNSDAAVQPQQFKSTTEGNPYFQKYPGHVDGQKLFPQISNFARPFEQPSDHSVYIKPNQLVHNFNVGSEVRFGQDLGVTKPTAPSLDLSSAFAHPSTRPFSRFPAAPSNNPELFRIFPVKEVNALPAFLPTPYTTDNGEVQRPAIASSSYYNKDNSGGSEEYVGGEQDENESDEQYGFAKSPVPTTTTTTTQAPPRPQRRRKPAKTTTTEAPEDEEYAIPLQQEEEPTTPHYVFEPAPIKYKKKKPLPTSVYSYRPREPVEQSEDSGYAVEQQITQAPPTTTTTTTTSTTTTTPQPITTAVAAETDSLALKVRTKPKYGNGTRPRFSIKDYKTAMSTTTTERSAPQPSPIRRTTTTTSTTQEPEAVEQTTVRKTYKPRARPNRFKSSTSTTTTTEEPQNEPEATTERRTVYRSKYKPGKYSYNRMRTSTEAATEAAAIEEQQPAETSRPAAVYSAKRRTLPKHQTPETEGNILRRSSVPPNEKVAEVMETASSEDVDYIVTSTASTSGPSNHKYHSFAPERPLLPIEAFFQSSLTGKRHVLR